MQWSTACEAHEMNEASGLGKLQPVGTGVQAAAYLRPTAALPCPRAGVHDYGGGRIAGPLLAPAHPCCL